MRASSRLLLLILLSFAALACTSATPVPMQPSDACSCAENLDLPAMPGPAGFVEARTKLAACFLRARAQSLAGNGGACDAKLSSAISRDLATLNATRDELERLLHSSSAGTSSHALLRANLRELDQAIAVESTYAQPVQQAARRDCPGTPLFKLEVQLARLPGEDHSEQFVERRRELAHCVKTLRDASLNALSMQHDDDADALLAAAATAENALVADTKRLMLQREQLLKELGERTVPDETTVLDKLHAVKTALKAVEPYVVVAGSDVTILETEFAVARKKHDDNEADAKQQKKCMDRFAYLDVSVGDDPKELIDCVERVRKVCRAETTPQRECELGLSRLEEKLRDYAGDQYVALNKLKAAHDSATDQKKNDDERAAISKRLDSIRDMEIIPDEGDIPEYSDYKRWWSKFALGYEYVSLNNAFSKGFARTGAMIGVNLPGQRVPDAPSRNGHLFNYGIFTAFSIGLTNTAEQTKTNISLVEGTPSKPSTSSTSSTNGTDDTKPSAKNVLAVEEQIFWPWWRSDLSPMDRRMRTWVGPIFTAGGRKTDDENEPFLATRFYEGIRIARSPEMYSDFLVGKSAGLRSRRAEVRGQMPLPHRFENGSRIVIGGIGNFGIDQRKHAGACVDSTKGRTCPELDTIRFYLSYDIGWSDLLKGFTGAK
jgi:hypothetical protein